MAKTNPKKNVKNPLTNPIKCGIIKMSKEIRAKSSEVEKPELLTDANSGISKNS